MSRFDVYQFTCAALTYASRTQRVDLHQHIQDVLAVLHHASVPISYDRQKPVYALNDGELALWIHKRCHRTIFRRVEAGKRAWPDHGLGAALESWTPEEYDRPQLKAAEINVPDDYWGVLQYCGVKSKTFDFDTAPDWIGAIGRILGKLEGMFVLDSVDQAPVLADPVGKLNALLAALNFILNIRQVKGVIKQSSLSSHVVRSVDGSYIRSLAKARVMANVVGPTASRRELRERETGRATTDPASEGGQIEGEAEEGKWLLSGMSRSRAHL